MKRKYWKSIKTRFAVLIHISDSVITYNTLCSFVIKWRFINCFTITHKITVHHFLYYSNAWISIVSRARSTSMFTSFITKRAP